MNHRMLSVAPLLTLLAGCSQAAGVHDSAADVASINQVRESEIAAFRDGQSGALVAAFTADAVVLPPDEALLKGHDALRLWAQGIVDRFTIAGHYTGSEVTVAGDWAFESYTGILTLTPRQGGDPVEERLKGLHVYRRLSDGTWRIAYDAWNSQAPPVAVR